MNITKASAKGERRYQEDTWLITEYKQGTLIGVFDGHGGEEASKYMAHSFENNFCAQLEPTDALRHAFERASAFLKDYDSGTTASVAFIPTGSSIVYTAVIGDSPIIIETLSGYWYGPDHNVRTNEAERDAAIQRGGFYNNGYICKGLHGPGLQMGRALGDAELSPILSHEPEISLVFPVGEWILIGTDGLFDPAHHNFKEAAEGVLAHIEMGADAQYLVDLAVAKPTRDNVTAILVRF